MNEEMYQNLFDKLQAVLPAYWNKVIFYAAYTFGGYSMKYYIVNQKSEFVDCFSLTGVNRAQLIRLFMSINQDLSSERDKNSNQDKWSVLTMIVDSNGNMKIEYDYTDISEIQIEYEQEWKKKYLIK